MIDGCLHNFGWRWNSPEKRIIGMRVKMRKHGWLSTNILSFLAYNSLVLLEFPGLLW